MLLSSVNRAILYTKEEDTADNRRKLLDWLTSLSKKTELFLQREIEIRSRTEYFDTIQYRHEYFPKAIPIFTTPEPVLDFDPMGQYVDESYTTLDYVDDFIVGGNSRSIVVLHPREPAYRGLRLTYTGGLAYHGVNSVFNYTAGTGTLTRDMFVVGDSSGALGRVVSAATTLTIEVLAGMFSETEDLTGYTNIDLNREADVTASITSVVSRALVESYPDIVKAVEIDLRYMSKHQGDFENVSTMQGQTTRRSTPTVYSRLQMVQQESEALLTPYRRFAIV